MPAFGTACYGSATPSPHRPHLEVNTRSNVIAYLGNPTSTVTRRRPASRCPARSSPSSSSSSSLRSARGRSSPTSRTRHSLTAARSYLLYALPCSTLLLLAIVWLESATGPVLFTEPPDLSGLDPASQRAIFALFIAGRGDEGRHRAAARLAALGHGRARPVSALLHAVAVVKAGAFGVIRVVYDVFGVGRVAELGVAPRSRSSHRSRSSGGRFQALRQSEIKRSGWPISTVSQVSYTVLGAALASPFAVIGGLAHLVHQGG